MYEASLNINVVDSMLAPHHNSKINIFREINKAKVAFVARVLFHRPFYAHLSPVRPLPTFNFNFAHSIKHEYTLQSVCNRCRSYCYLLHCFIQQHRNGAAHSRCSSFGIFAITLIIFSAIHDDDDGDGDKYHCQWFQTKFTTLFAFTIFVVQLGWANFWVG